MGRLVVKVGKKLTCPSCNAAIHFRPEKDDIGTCPRCGEWLMRRGRWSRHLERLDYEPSIDFDESDDWEKPLIDEIE